METSIPSAKWFSYDYNQVTYSRSTDYGVLTDCPTIVSIVLEPVRITQFSRNRIICCQLLFGTARGGNLVKVFVGQRKEKTEQEVKLRLIYRLGSQAARKLGSFPAVRSELKYLSSVLIAASRTRWQSEQVSRWRLISPSTDEERRPSKYQQIRWIVSLQLISPVPQVSQRPPCDPRKRCAFPAPNTPLGQRILSIYESWT